MNKLKILDSDRVVIDGIITFFASSDGKVRTITTSSDELYAHLRELLSNDGNNKDSIDELVKDENTKTVNFLFTGLDFLNNVSSGYITNNDGFICRVFINGKSSNLGLFHESKNFQDGYFLVDDKMWRNICENSEVYVDWANN